MNNLYSYVESVISWFLPSSILTSDLYINFLLPFSQILMGYWMLYFMLIKPIVWFLGCISKWVK